jgi:2-aminoethylphosphonate dioxygenase
LSYEGWGYGLIDGGVNYKLAGSGGFSPHIDSTAYTHVRNIKHLTILIAVDPSNMSNGGLEVVEGSHLMEVPIDRTNNCLEPSWVKSQAWVPVELEAGLHFVLEYLHMQWTDDIPGQILIFGSYLAHRSGPNNSNSDRKAIYATYNCKSEGDLHDEYYADRAKIWPPTHKRLEGQKYDVGAMRYGYGSPMLSVDLGKQYVV